MEINLTLNRVMNRSKQSLISIVRSKHIINHEQLMHMILFLDHYITTNYLLLKTEGISARPTRVQ